MYKNSRVEVGHNKIGGCVISHRDAGHCELEIKSCYIIKQCASVVLFRNMGPSEV